MSQLVRNSIITPDGTVLVSQHQHDFVIHEDKNGKKYGIDGGISGYGRLVGDMADCTDNRVYADDDFEIVREAMTWGTRGPDGDQPLTYVFLKDMESSHIQAILDTQRQVNADFRNLFEKELDYRKTLLRSVAKSKSSTKV